LTNNAPCAAAGHNCDDDNKGLATLEFNVDANEFIQQEATGQHECGGTTSIRAKDELSCPLMIFGLLACMNKVHTIEL
jgi:hypothetical protein